MLYFAYGANMYHENMKKRCPEYKFLGRAVLKGYQFIYDGQSRLRGGGIANIALAPREVVWGGLYEISESESMKLDKYEGSPKYFQRRIVPVKNDQGQILQAMVYIRPALTQNPPSPSYKQEVLLGAEDCGLPEDYVKNNL